MARRPRFVNNSVTLWYLAQDVEDLVDGLGGDEQEQHRGAAIAHTLRTIANGGQVAPLEEHARARRAYFRRVCREMRTSDEAEARR
jgi:hypothetical protein